MMRWDGSGVEPVQLDAMATAIAHRGPDGAGSRIWPGVGLSHRRLAIIDLEAGGQPMGNEDGSVWITFNGEVYNYRALRDELSAAGHQFTTASDTEVIIHAYEQWGDACVRHLRGMFGFAIADHARQRLLLARDPFGIKPLYYRQASSSFAFCSELAGLKALPEYSPRMDPMGMDLFLRFGYIPAPHTIYRDVWKLPPGHTLAVDFDGRHSGPQRYWQLRFTSDADEMACDDTTYVKRAEEVIRESVSAHLVSDVPFGVFLSGGIDSTLVAMYMSELLERPVKAFSIGFDESAMSELDYAKQVAQHCGLELHTEIVQPEAVDLLPKLVAHYGEPFADSSALPTWYVSRLARRHVPMVLSGDGGDESFGGYPRYRHIGHETFGQVASAWWHRPTEWPMAARWLAGRFQRGGRMRLDRWLQMNQLFPDAARRRLWRPAYRECVDTPCAAFIQAASEAEAYAPATFGQYMDHQTYLPGDILTKVDIAAMYHGLEVRTPLVDRHVVEFAAGLPLGQRLRTASDGTVTLKRLPKQLLEQRFPRDFVHRRKRGFSVPVNRWLRRGTPVRTMLETQLAQQQDRLHAWFDRRQIRRLLREHDVTGRRGPRLWALLTLTTWLQQNPDVAPSEAR